MSKMRVLAKVIAKFHPAQGLAVVRKREWSRPETLETSLGFAVLSSARQQRVVHYYRAPLTSRGYLDICRDHDRRGRPRRKLPRRRPLGLGPQRRRRGTRPTTSSVDSATECRCASRLCRRKSPRPCTSLIVSGRSLNVRRSHRRRPPTAQPARPLVRRGEGLLRRNGRP